uniref:Uncharacterized protein n=1 Tax=Sphenodon punctatus TaxID=8508 RepID=A0A8D0H8N4_SPHPU
RSLENITALFKDACSFQTFCYLNSNFLNLFQSQQKCIVIFALVCCFAILVALIFSAVDIVGEDEDGLSEKNCQNNCRIALVENIPEGINYSDSAPSHLSLFQGWMNLLNMAEKSVDIVSSKWDLCHNHPSACLVCFILNGHPFVQYLDLYFTVHVLSFLKYRAMD